MRPEPANDDGTIEDDVQTQATMIDFSFDLFHGDKFFFGLGRSNASLIRTRVFLALGLDDLCLFRLCLYHPVRIV